jgi:hypothetical protein
MNLLSRLSNEHYLILIQGYKHYPISTQIIIDELTNLKSWAELKFSTINYLVYNLNLENHEPTTIQNIFKNESIKH